MSGRYEIEGILAQDERGVIFRAIERESGGGVVLRRFFPYGREGGGLDAAAQEIFARALEGFKSVRHSSLRRVLDGGCDPVDGMPFLVTEWLEGVSLARFAGGKAVATASVKGILEEALDASLELSRVLGKEALWIECAPESVIIPESGRGISFWVSPFRWSGGDRVDRGLLPLAELAEKLLGWTGRPPADSAGDGLGAWVRHIRTSPTGWNLRDARIFLHEPVQGLPPEPVRKAPGMKTSAATAAPTRALAGRRKRRPVWPWVLGGACAALALGGVVLWRTGTWNQLVRHVKAEPPPVAKSGWQDLPSPPPPPAAQRPPGSWDFAGKAEPVAPAPAPAPAAPPPSSSSTAAAGAAAPPAQPAAAAPAPLPSAENAITGKVLAVEESGSGQTYYLKVEVEGGVRYIGLHRIGGFSPGERQVRDSFVGRKIRAGGKIREEAKRGAVVNVNSWAEIQVLE